MTGQGQEGLGGQRVTGQSQGGEKAEEKGGSETDEEGKLPFFCEKVFCLFKIQHNSSLKNCYVV